MVERDPSKRRLAVLRGLHQGEAWVPGPKFYGKQVVKRAAEYFGVLDLSDPEDRDHLLYLLAEALFGKETGGRPLGTKRWDKAKYLHLAAQDELVRKKNPRLSDTRISKIIFEEHKEFHSAETIRQRLPAARRAAAKAL